MAAEQFDTQRMPHNLEAERALLGAMLLDNEQIEIAHQFLPPAGIDQAKQFYAGKSRKRVNAVDEPLFYGRANQGIFCVLFEMHDRGQGVDLTTLADALQARGMLEEVGGPSYLASLEDDIFSLNQVPEYARIVADKWKLRCLIRAAHEIVVEASQSDAPPAEIVDRSEKRIFDVAQDHDQADFKHASTVVVDLIHEIEGRHKGNQEAPGVKTHFKELDVRTAGLRPSQLIILAARPSMGKTAFALNIASNVALKENRPVAVFSLEMSAEELLTRMMCTIGQVPMGRVRLNVPLKPHEESAMQEAAERLMNAPLFIDDSSSLSPLELRARARRLKARNPELGLVIVDYLQLMHGSATRQNESRQQEVSEISRSLKGLARELGVPVIALSQLSRQIEQRRGAKDKLPRLSDLRESGAIEQDADIVMFIHRDRDMEQAPSDSPEPEIATVRIGKQRNGAIGDFNLLFRGQFTEFCNLVNEFSSHG